MDAVQMRNLMEHYGKLKAGLDACKGNIRRIKSSTFDEYVEEKTYRSTLGESRLDNSGLSNPTEMLGMYGRQQFEQERDFELRCEQRRLSCRTARSTSRTMIWPASRTTGTTPPPLSRSRRFRTAPGRPCGRSSSPPPRSCIRPR